MGLKGFFDKLNFSSLNGERNGFGLVFSDSHLRVLSIELDSGKIFSKFLKSLSLAEDLVRDGKILDKKLLTEKLESLRAKLQEKGIRLDDFELVVPVPESRCYSTIFKLSKGARNEEVKKAVSRKANNVASINVEESYSDYGEIPSRKDYKEVLFVAIPKKIIDDYSAVANQAGFDVDVFEPEFLSLSRAFYPLLQAREEVIIFDCGKRGTNVTVFAQEAPRHFAEIKLAGEKFTQAIANNLNVSSNKAETLKKEQGLGEEKTRKALAPVLNSLISQFTKILEDIRVKQDLEPESLLLCGGTSLMSGFEDYFEKNLNLEVIHPTPFSDHKIEVPNGSLTESQIRYSALLGASLRGINKSSPLPSINFISN